MCAHPHQTDQLTWGEHCLERTIDSIVDLLPCLESRELRVEAAQLLTRLIAHRTPTQVRRLEIARGLAR